MTMNARMLGHSRSMVHTTERDTMQRLQALTQGQATLTTRNGKVCISLPGCRTPSVSPERGVLLSETARRLEAEGQSLIAPLLARETGVPVSVAAEFLRQLRGESASVTRLKEARQHRRVQRLEEEYASLAAEGQTPSGCVLARRARVAKPTALAFLRARKEERDAAQAR